MSDAHQCPDASVKDAFIELVPAEKLAHVYQKGSEFPYAFGFVANMGRLLLTHPDIGPPFRALFAQVMFKPGHLSRVEREMVASVAAAAQDCHY